MVIQQSEGGRSLSREARCCTQVYDGSYVSLYPRLTAAYFEVSCHSFKPVMSLVMFVSVTLDCSLSSNNSISVIPPFSTGFMTSFHKGEGGGGSLSLVL